MFASLLGLVVLGSTVADAQGFVYLDLGAVHRVDKTGNATVVTCTRGYHVDRLPEETQPCSLGGLVVEPTSGRMAFTVDVPAGFAEERAGRLRAFSWVTGVRLNGRDLSLPSGATPLSGSFVVVSDAAGTNPTVMTGIAETWRRDGRFSRQTPLAFTRDGNGLLVAEDLGSERSRLWLVDLRGSPRWRVQQGARIFQRVTLAPGADAIELHSSPKHVAFLRLPDTVEADQPLVTRVLPGALAVAMVRDDVVSFEEGDCEADSGAAAVHGQYWRTDAAGRSSVWRESPLCRVQDTVAFVSTSRHSVFLVEKPSLLAANALIEYDLSRDAVTRHSFDPRGFLALSPDGRALALLKDGGIEVRRLDDGELWWRADVKGTNDIEVRLAFF